MAGKKPVFRSEKTSNVGIPCSATARAVTPLGFFIGGEVAGVNAVRAAFNARHLSSHLRKNIRPQAAACGEDELRARMVGATSQNPD